MKVIYNSLIPFKGFIAINLFGVIFARHENATKVDSKTITHEAIHTAQMKELGYVFFYLIYFFEWLVKLFKYGKDAYYHISFELEAMYWQPYYGYIEKRKHFAQWRGYKNI